MNRLVIAAACLTFGCIASTEGNVHEYSVKFTLFYQSYCKYSKHFIVDQLYGSWKKFKHHLKLDMVPFGLAEQTYEDGHFKFSCQHKAKECAANILHACAIHEACDGRGTVHCPVTDLAKVMDYILCIMKKKDQKKASDKCATSAGLLPHAINQCADGELGNRLESFYGNQTSTFNNPPVNYLPFVALNDRNNANIQNDADADLNALICKYIHPDQCE